MALIIEILDFKVTSLSPRRNKKCEGSGFSLPKQKVTKKRMVTAERVRFIQRSLPGQ